MRARDVMTAPPVVVQPETPVEEIARLLLNRRISAVPVVATDARLLGIVSEGDLLRRVETGTQREPSWWLTGFAHGDGVAREYARSRGRRAADVMTREVITVGEDARLPEIVTLLERHRIKRVPVMRDGKVIGIVSRANLLQGLASGSAVVEAPAGGEALRKRVIEEMERAGVDAAFVNVVNGEDGVHLWGIVRSPEQLDTARIAAETAAGGRPVLNHLSVPSGVPWAAIWI